MAFDRYLEHSSSFDVDDPEWHREASVPRRPSPGKVTLTSRLQPRARAPVMQARAEGLRSAFRTVERHLVSQWNSAAFRPDLHDAPDNGSEQRRGSGEDAAVHGGHGMPAGVRAKMEQAFGADFSAVRIYQSERARELGAQAYTQGSDIYFAPGRYQPHSQEGQELLGHELTHVLQQAAGRIAPTWQRKGISVNDNPALEREADASGARAARGEVVAPRGRLATVQPSGQGAIQRRIERTAKDWFEEPDAIANPGGDQAGAKAREQVEKYLYQHPVASGGKTFDQELARVKPFVSQSEADDLNTRWTSLKMDLMNGTARHQWLQRIDALGARINAAADKIALAGGEEAHGQFRAVYGGTVETLNKALALAGSAQNLQTCLDQAEQELVKQRAQRKKKRTDLLEMVQTALHNRAGGLSVRNWGHRGGGSVVIFWVDGLDGYWDFAEVHVHVNMPEDTHTKAAPTDETGYYAALRSVAGERYHKAVNIRKPYSGIASGQDLAPDHPVAVLCLNHPGYDPDRWGERQGNLATY